MEYVREKWTGDLVGKMHNSCVTRKDLADEIGVTKSYVTMILNGKRSPIGARYILEGAFREIIAKRAAENHEC